MFEADWGALPRGGVSALTGLELFSSEVERHPRERWRFVSV